MPPVYVASGILSHSFSFLGNRGNSIIKPWRVGETISFKSPFGIMWSTSYECLWNVSTLLKQSMCSWVVEIRRMGLAFLLLNILALKFIEYNTKCSYIYHFACLLFVLLSRVWLRCVAWIYKVWSKGIYCFICFIWNIKVLFSYIEKYL